MAAVTKCPKCGTRYKTEGVEPGKRVKCKKCDAVFEVAADTPPPTNTRATPQSSPELTKADADLSTGVMLGKCRIEKLLGRGGMGAVYLAEHTALDVPVAVKILPSHIADQHPRFAERFVREAKLAARIRHANVMAVMDVEQDEATGLHFIVLEFVDGGSVRDCMREGPMGEEKALDVTIGVTEALVAAARHDIIHRDIKPDNIMMTAQGEVKLADLGLAKALGDVDGSGATMSGAVMGTPAYMSPEQAGDAKNCDARTDIYSLGATLYHMLTGDQPFKGETTYNVLLKIGTEPTPDPRTANPDISEATAALCMKMMAKDREDRHATAEELLEDLRAIRYGSVTDASALPSGVVAPGGVAVADGGAPAPRASGVEGNAPASAAVPSSKADQKSANNGAAEKNAEDGATPSNPRRRRAPSPKADAKGSKKRLLFPVVGTTLIVIVSVAIYVATRPPILWPPTEERAALAQDILSDAPEHDKANLCLGAWECFENDDWKNGLPYLAKGSHEELRKAARLDAEIVAMPNASRSLGKMLEAVEQYWAAREAMETDSLKKSVWNRGLHWARMAFDHPEADSSSNALIRCVKDKLIAAPPLKLRGKLVVVTDMFRIKAAVGDSTVLDMDGNYGTTYIDTGEIDLHAGDLVRVYAPNGLKPDDEKGTVCVGFRSKDFGLTTILSGPDWKGVKDIGNTDWFAYPLDTNADEADCEELKGCVKRYAIDKRWDFQPLKNGQLYLHEIGLNEMLPVYCEEDQKVSTLFPIVSGCSLAFAFDEEDFFEDEKHQKHIVDLSGNGRHGAILDGTLQLTEGFVRDSLDVAASKTSILIDLRNGSPIPDKEYHGDFSIMYCVYVPKDINTPEKSGQGMIYVQKDGWKTNTWQTLWRNIWSYPFTGDTHFSNLPPPLLGEWHMMVMTSQNMNMFLYQNGKVVGQKREERRSHLPCTHAWVSGMLHCHSKAYGTESSFQGCLDDFAIWRRALSPGEIEVLYQSVKNGESFCQYSGKAARRSGSVWPKANQPEDPTKDEAGPAK